MFCLIAYGYELKAKPSKVFPIKKGYGYFLIGGQINDRAER